MAAHTNADDATRYREDDEVRPWLARDPIARLETYLRDRGALDDAEVAAIADGAETEADALRQRMLADPEVRPLDLFDHVFAEPTPQLREQRDQLLAELGRAGVLA
jgi:pyruvate dehydrogenase E1 component alpha subunit